MLEFYEKLKESFFKNQTQFKTFVEEVCENKPKGLISSTYVQPASQNRVSSGSSGIRKNSYEGTKERSMTNGSSDFSKSSNYTQNNLNTQNGSHGHNQNHKTNEKVFIPRNNPLAEMSMNK